MSEVYWVWGGEITTSGELSGLLQAQAGIRPAWIEEMHWLSAFAGQSATAVDGFSASLPLFRWEMPGMQDHYLLQSVGRAVMLEHRDLVVIVEEKQAKLSALALASPRAVGRYNLLPHARLIFLPSIQIRPGHEPIDSAQTAAGLLEPIQLPLDQVTWLADSGEWDGSGALGSINELVNSLDINKGSNALLVSPTSFGVALGTLLERI
jgi:hypothetical protein